MANPITDPALLAQLNASDGPMPVSDPDLLAKLNDHDSVPWDVAKSAGTGLVKGAIGMAGLIPDISAAAHSAANKYLFDPLLNATIGKPSQPEVERTVDPNKEFGSAGLQSALESAGVPLHKPQTVAGEYAQTAGEFAPALLGGGEGLISKLATRVAAPAAASETAGQLTKGTEAEPYARLTAAILAGGGAAKLAENRAATKTFNAANPSKEEVKSAATDVYEGLNNRNTAIPISQDELHNVADDITSTLNKNAIRPSTADKIHAAVNEIRTPATDGAPDVADLVSARENIKSLLSSPDRNKAGAAIAVPKIDAAIERLSPGTMQSLREADKNYSAFKANEALDKRLARADLRAAGEHSGLNTGNRIRQNVTNYLLSKEANYLSDANKASLKKVVEGTPVQNLMRFASNITGGGGGLGSTLLGLTSGAAGIYSGHPEASLIPLGGIGLRMASNRMTANQAARAAAEIRSRSPLGQDNLAKTLSPTMQSPVTPGVMPPNPHYVAPVPRPGALTSGLTAALLAAQGDRLRRDAQE